MESLAVALAILVVVLVLGGFSVAILVVLLQGFRGRQRGGPQSPSEKFEADAKRLHRMVHPEDDPSASN